MLTLRILEGKEAGREISFPSLPVVMGRDVTCDLALPDRSISRRHALILGTTDSPFIRDLGSANGTYLNRQRVAREAALEPGDRIQIGTTVLEVGGATVGTRRPRVDVREDFAELATSVVQARVEAERTNLKDLDLSQLDAPSMQARLNSLYRVTELIARSGTQSLRNLLEGILDIAFDALPADHGAILLGTSGGDDDLQPEVARTRGEAISEPVAISRTILKRCLDERVAILSIDVQSDSRFGTERSSSLKLMRSAICVPLIRAERVLGVLHVDTRVSGARLAQADLELLTGIGNEAALAIENARLAQEMMARERLAAVGRTMAEFSHHVKNVLQGLAVYAPLLDDALAEAAGGQLEIVTSSWGRVKGYHERLERTVRDVLSFAGERTPVLVMTQPADVVARVGAALEDRARMGRVRIELDVPAAPLPLCRLDPEWIVGSLVNLGLNAIEAMEQQTGGMLKISTWIDASQSALRFVVADTGPGIPAHLRARLFECFFSTKGLKGTGLGLPIARRFVEAHGGTVELDANEGTGTRFLVTLPLDLGVDLTTHAGGAGNTERHNVASGDSHTPRAIGRV